MRRIFTLVSILFLLCSKGQSQECVVMGCASNAATFGTQTANPAQPDNTSGILEGCYGGAIPFKQVFWEFFLSTAGGDLVQTFTPVGNTNGLDLDYAVWDIGNVAPNPATLNCPINPGNLGGNGWTQIQCNSESTGDLPTGPGIAPAPPLPGPQTVPTVAGHYYAVGIILSGVGTGPDYTFTVGAATLGGAAMTSANCFDITLPLKLSSFGARVNNCVVNLNWVSESETDFKNYQIESSTDGVSFKAIATISPLQNNTGSTQKYSYQDKAAQQGKTYYRLKMIDIDGSFSYSNIIPLILDCNLGSVIVYPNPVHDVLNINVTNSNDNSTNANLYDLDGRLVLAKKLISGTNLIDMKRFPGGLYLLELNNNGVKQHFKIIK